ncbi:MAG: hypothetical protein KDD69_13910 [Bdellovibrionales bacterium]|nr:hypothetical protein [Bdellovibrionales bacterium]
MTNDSTKLTPTRFWILVLYAIIGVFGAALLYKDLRGSSVSHVNALKSAHLIASGSAFIWTILFFRGLIESAKSMMRLPAKKPTPIWFLPFALLSILWLFLLMGELNFRELFFNNSDFWWLDSSSWGFNETLSSFCGRMDAPPKVCDAEWFTASGTRNHFLVEAYQKAVTRIVALSPSLLILLSAWIFSYKEDRDA